MPIEKVQSLPNAALVDFMQRYTQTLTMQIEAIQSQMETSVTGVMESLTQLSTSTEGTKKEAERVLEQTYFNPDASTSALVDSIQQSTDDLFEMASQAMAKGQDVSAVSNSESTEDRGAEIRRMGGLFSKHMESMSTLDDSVKNIVLGMVGAMSTSDIVKQRLDHLAMVLRALHVGLSNILLDLDMRLQPQAIQDFRTTLLDYAYSTYTTEQERAAFKEIFGAPPALEKAYGKSQRKVS